MSRTYGSLAYSDRQWTMSAVEPHVAIRLKQLFPRIRKESVGPFSFPDDAAHCADLAWFITRYPLAISHEHSRRLHRGRRSYKRTQAELEKILSPQFAGIEDVALKPGQELRKYQQQAAAVTLMRKSLLLGDDIGLGKTYTAAGFMLSKLARPAAVVMQTHLQAQWSEKIEAFTHLKTHRIKGTKPYSLPPADVYLFKYSQLAGWVDFFATKFFRSCAFDEIQELRTGSESQKGCAAKILSDKAEYRLGLSATPIYNFGGELWNIYRVIDDGVLGTREEFDREWCSQGRIIKDPKALGTFLREQHVFLRRTKADVGQQMPPVNVIVEAVDSDDEALASVESLARALAIRTTTGTFEERGRASRELDLLVRQATGVAKAKGVAQYVRLFMETGTPVVLAGWHRNVYEIWNRELAEFKPVMYTGTESPAQKQASVRAFLEGQTNLFIISLRSGAGLDGLQDHCSTVIFGELDWSPKIHEQVIGRLDREGQKEAVTAIFLNAADGSDPPMVDLLGLKNAQASAVIDPNAPIQSRHTDLSRIQVLAQRYLSKRDGPAAPVAEPAGPVSVEMAESV